MFKVFKVLKFVGKVLTLGLLSPQKTLAIKIASKIAKMIVKNTPTKLDDEILGLIKREVGSLSDSDKADIASLLTKDKKFNPKLKVDFCNSEFKIKDK